MYEIINLIYVSTEVSRVEKLFFFKPNCFTSPLPLRTFTFGSTAASLFSVVLVSVLHVADATPLIFFHVFPGISFSFPFSRQRPVLLDTDLLVWGSHVNSCQYQLVLFFSDSQSVLFCSPRPLRFPKSLPIPGFKES